MENTSLIRSEFRMLPIDEVKGWYNDFVAFSKSILHEDHDYGVIPGTNKPTLYKAGAEKLRFAYGLGVEMQMINNIIDWENMFVDCTYKAIIKTKAGQIIAECEGNVNSEEQKYKYIWVNENDVPKNINKDELKTKGGRISEFTFSIEKAETTGKYGKPREYWQQFQNAISNQTAKLIQKKSSNGKLLNAYEIDSTLYRIKNPDVIGLRNTMMKMAQKRAFVGAILIATGASEFYTQDIEDMDLNGNGYIYSDNNIITVENTLISWDSLKKSIEKSFNSVTDPEKGFYLLTEKLQKYQENYPKETEAYETQIMELFKKRKSELELIQEAEKDLINISKAGN